MFGKVSVGVALLVTPPVRVKVPPTFEKEGEGEVVSRKGEPDTLKVPSRVGALVGLGALPLGELQGEGGGESEGKPLTLCVGPTAVGVFAEDGGNVGDIVPVTPMLALPVGVVTPTDPVGVVVVVAPADTLPPPPPSAPVAVRLGVSIALSVFVTLGEEEMERELVKVAPTKEGEAVGVGDSVLGR